MEEDQPTEDDDEELSTEELDEMHDERCRTRSFATPMGEYFALLDLVPADRVEELFTDKYEVPPKYLEEYLDTAAQLLVEAGDTHFFMERGKHMEEALDIIQRGIRIEYLRAEYYQDEWEPIFTLWDFMAIDYIQGDPVNGLLQPFYRRKMRVLGKLAIENIDHERGCQTPDHARLVTPDETDKLDEHLHDEGFQCSSCNEVISRGELEGANYRAERIIRELDPEVDN